MKRGKLYRMVWRSGEERIALNDSRHETGLLMVACRESGKWQEGHVNPKHNDFFPIWENVVLCEEVSVQDLVLFVGWQVKSPLFERLLEEA